MSHGPELQKIVEALLFASDSPLGLGELCEIAGECSRSDVENAVRSLIEAYESDDSVLQLIEIANGYQFTTRPRYHRWIRKLKTKRRDGKLSGASLETLAVIAYKQPVSRAEIERVRGVSVDGVLHTLLGRDLIRITGREKGIGRALLYGTTREFLFHFGLKDLRELPSFEELERLFGPEASAARGSEKDSPPEAVEQSVQG